MKNDLLDLEKELLLNPEQGISLGNNCYKIRLKIASKGKGKSGGARVISYLETELIVSADTNETLTTINLITIYDKSQTESITDKELKQLIANR